jgi:hypothetical protein
LFSKKEYIERYDKDPLICPSAGELAKYFRQVNENSVLLEGEEFLEEFRILVSQEGLCAMKLFCYSK